MGGEEVGLQGAGSRALSIEDPALVLASLDSSLSRDANNTI